MTRKGARVRVMSVDKDDLGLGTYQGDVTVEIVWKDGESFSLPTPEILLDSGRTIHGYECWWTETEVEP